MLLKTPTEDNTISFSVWEDVIIKVTKEWFFYKWVFVEDPQNVYGKFIEFFESAKRTNYHSSNL
jgi:hypothetical protein